MTTTWAVANQKGGVGKTTVTLFLAEALANLGKKVLVVDLDPQASATKVLAAESSGLLTMADLLLAPEGHSVLEVAQSTEWGFDLAPSEIALAGRESRRELGDEFMVRKCLSEAAAYDMVLIDCPPSLGVLTVNALVAATRLLLVTEPSYVALQGVSELLATVDVVREHYHPALSVGGVIINLMDHTRESAARAAEVASFFAAGELMQPYVPRRTVLREAASEGKSLGRMRGANAELSAVFASLAEQVADRG